MRIARSSGQRNPACSGRSRSRGARADTRAAGLLVLAAVLGWSPLAVAQCPPPPPTHPPGARDKLLDEWHGQTCLPVRDGRNARASGSLPMPRLWFRHTCRLFVLDVAGQRGQGSFVGRVIDPTVLPCVTVTREPIHVWVLRSACASRHPPKPGR